MKANRQAGPSFWSLALDLLSARVLAWLASVGRDADLTPEAHIFFFDRYHRLAAYHRARGRLARAQRLQAKADYHYHAGGGNGPPYAAAMAMPRPRGFVRVRAISTNRFDAPDDAA